MRQDLIDAALELPPAERIEFIGRVWDSLSTVDDPCVLSPAQMDELRRREERLEREGPQGEDWEVVKRRLLEGRRR